MPANTTLYDARNIIMWMRSSVMVMKDNECWPHIGNINNSGYGTVSQELFGVQKQVAAHRIMWELFNGPIPEDMVIDHMCHNEALSRGECLVGSECKHRRCVNPSHLRLLTFEENTRIGRNGFNENTGKCRNQLHDWIPDNILERNNRRWCKLCMAESRKKRAPMENEKRKVQRRLARKAKG